MRCSSYFLLLLIASSHDGPVGPPASAFCPPSTSARVGLSGRGGTSDETSPTALFKGGKNARKQMELAKKMALAKEQARLREGGGEGEATSAAVTEAAEETAKGRGKSGRLTDADVKAENDRKRFDDLLNSESATAMFEFNAKSGYLTREQEEEAATAGFRGVDRKFEGDPAPTAPFEDLVSIHTENALGGGGPSRLVPWLHRNTARHKDYLIVITDPREKSTELRSAVKSLTKKLSRDVLSRLIVVNADAPPENRRWLNKNGMSDDVSVYSDEKREWMREYTALGEKRWAMCMFILADGRIQKLVREMDGDLASTVVQNAVRSLDY